MNKLLAQVRHIFAVLLTPPPIITESRERDAAYIANFLLFMQAVVSGFVLLSVSLIAPNWHRYSLELTLLTLTIPLFGFLFARFTIYFRLAMFCVSCFTIVGIFFAYLSGTTFIPMRAFAFLILPLGAMGVVLSSRVTIFAGFITTLVFIFLEQQRNPLIEESYLTAIVFILLTSTSISIVLYIREQQELQHQLVEERVRGLMAANFEWVVIYNQTGVILDANKAFEDVMQLSLQNIVGKRITTFIMDNYHQQLFTKHNHLTNESFEIKAITPKKEEIIIRTRLRPYAYLNENAFVLIAQEITQQVANEQKRHEAELRNKALFNNTSDAVYIIGLDNRIVEANQAGADLFGTTCKQLIGRSAGHHVMQEEQSEIANVVARLHAGEKIPVYQRKFRKESGEVFDAEVNVMMVWNEDGTPLYIQSLVRDMSDRNREEKQRLDFAIQGQRYQLLQDFLGDASHHFRTPLANIKTAVYLNKRLQDETRRQEQWEVIDDEIGRMEILLNDLLTIVRLNRKNMSEMTLRPVKLHQLIRGYYSIFTTQNPDKTLTLHLNDDVDGTILGNYQQLEQAIVHLLQICLLYAPDSTYHIHLDEHNGLVILDVVDDGIGIEAEALPHIFDFFYRSDNARAINSMRNGMGLAICQRVVENHRGMIQVFSEEGQGTHVRAIIPTIDNFAPNSMQMMELYFDLEYYPFFETTLEQ